MAQRKTTDLHVKLLNGDWSGAEHLLSTQPDLMFYKEEKNGRLSLNHAMGLPVPPPNHLLMLLVNTLPGELINEQDDDGWSALIAAAFCGHHELVDCLLDSGASCHIVNKKGNTSLHLACEHGQLKCVELLIKAKSDLNIKNNYGWTPLISASLRGHHEIICRLIEAKSLINSVSNDGWTALMSAASAGHHKAVGCLLDSEASVDISNKMGNTALHLASQDGHLKCIELLSKATKNLNVQNNNGWTPLFTAALKGHPKVVQFFIDAGASLDIVSKDSWTALMAAASVGHDKVALCLLNSDASIGIANKVGNRALHLASCHGHVDCVKELIKSTCNLNIQNYDGCTALFRASSKGHSEVVRSFIQADASLDVPNKKGITALHEASYHGHSNVVDLLLKSGANSNLLTEDGSSVLHYCVLNPGSKFDQHYSVSSLLIKHNPQLLSVTNKNGASPLMLYEQSKCDQYNKTDREKSKKMMMKILNAGPSNELNLTSKNFNQLLVDVSSWWNMHRNIHLLKVLLCDFKITISILEKTSEPFNLIRLLEPTGEISQFNIDVLIEAIYLGDLMGVEQIVRKTVPTFAGFSNFKIQRFSKGRQRIIKFGNVLSKANTEIIAHLYGIDTNQIAGDQWILIFELEKKDILSPDKIDSFIETLERNGMTREVEALTEK